MKKQQMKLESLNGSKFEALPTNVMNNISGGYMFSVETPGGTLTNGRQYGCDGKTINSDNGMVASTWYNY